MKFALLFVGFFSLLLSSCVSWHENSLVSEPAKQTLTLVSGQAGLLMGPCSFFWGKTKQVDAVIVLHGTKSVYSGSDIEILGHGGKRWRDYKNGELVGTVTVEERSHAATINVKIQGESFYHNGRYHFQQSSSPR